MENRRDMSQRLNKILNMVGASEKMRRLHRRTATDFTTINMAVHNDDELIYICGSRYEGSVTLELASDVDKIQCFVEPPIVLHRRMASTRRAFLMVTDVWTYPGYVKLQCLYDGHPLTFDCIEATENFGPDQSGRACLKYIRESGNMQGPAEQYFDSSGKHVCDLVLAHKCNGIPLWATEWITRERGYGWPSQQHLDEMKMMGCLVVRAGHYTSPERDVEWRLSFSLQERMLMKRLNHIQHKVYILMKMIKKNVVENHFNHESLSSYHFKTCIFYMAENTPSDMWTEDNLINCLIECLKLLLRWVTQRYCPSFFIEEQNLFEKEGFHGLLEPLQRLFYQLLQTGHQFLFLLRTDKVGEMLRGDLRMYRHISDVRVNAHVFHLKREVITMLMHSFKRMLFASICEENVLSFLVSQLNKIQCDVRIRDTKALLYIQPWLHLYIGMEFAARSAMCLYKPACKELMKSADAHLHLARNTDFATIRLVKASILYSFKQFEECFLLLQELERSWNDCVTNYCACQGGDLFFPSVEQLYESFPSMQTISVTQIMRNFFCFCMAFLPSQTELVPLPLQYEMWRSLGSPPGSRNERLDYWFDWAVIDATIYMYLLQYLVCAQLDREYPKQTAMYSLASLLEWPDIKYIYHKDTAYNMLGWIYLQEHRIEDAVQCFLKSWQIRPFHNAAKFHVLDIYRNMVERQTPLSERS